MNDHNKPTGPKGPMAGTMQGATAQKRKSLNRETQIKIGAQLQMTYNEIVNQGVPDRFVQLIRRLESEAVEDAASGVHGGGLAGAKDTPSDKGS